MFAPNFPCRHGSESYVNGKLALAFLNAGWMVDVITVSDRGIPFQEDCSAMWGPLKKHTHFASLGSSLLDYRVRMLAWSYSAYLIALELMRANKYDVVLSRCQPIWAHLPALFLSRNAHLPWIANWNDPSPIRRSPPPLGSGLHAHVPFIEERMFRRISNQASWHTFPSDRLRIYMLSYMPANVRQKSSVVPHIALEQPATHPPKRDSLMLMHFGSMYLRKWETLLEGLRLFRDRKGNSAALSVPIRWVAAKGDHGKG